MEFTRDVVPCTLYSVLCTPYSVLYIERMWRYPDIPRFEAQIFVLYNQYSVPSSSVIILLPSVAMRLIAIVRK